MAAKKKSETKKPSLDIFKVLTALDCREYDWLDNQDPELVKTFTPVTVMRWMSTLKNDGPDSEYYILAVNEFANIGFWDLVKYPDLQWKLLALCGSGYQQRHGWIAGSKKTTTTKFEDILLSHNPSLNEMEINILMSRYDENSIRSYLEDYGFQDKDIDDIIKDYRKKTNG